MVKILYLRLQFQYFKTKGNYSPIVVNKNNLRYNKKNKKVWIHTNTNHLNIFLI